MRTIRFLTFLLLAVFLCACGQTVDNSASISPTDTIMPVGDELHVDTTAETAPVFMAVVFEDDFSDPESGWERYQEFDGVLDYMDGGYRMFISTVENIFWVQANLESPMGDLAVQVDVKKLGGPDDAPFGVLCRLDEQYQYYFFYITGNGEFAIGKHIAEQGFLNDVLIGMDTPRSSDVIRQGDQAENTILAICQGQTLSLTINGELLAEVQDSDLLMGDAGLLAGARQEPNLDVWFDSIKVMEPNRVMEP